MRWPKGWRQRHDAGLVHRDIKPGNVWLVQKEEATKVKEAKNVIQSSDGMFLRVRILDFGLARLTADDLHLTQSGAIMGTPAYMAPEQARGKAVDHRADLFSLGVMLYEMTIGRRPFSGNDTMSMLTSLAIDEPTAPNAIDPAIPVAMSDLIMQLLSKSPDKRPADAHVVSEALLAILTQAAPPIVEAMPRSGAVPMASAADATAIDPWQAIDEPDLDVTTSTPSAGTIIT